MMDQSKAFFSYSRDDSEFVLRLANDLKKRDVDIWVDQLDIPPGAKWDIEIEKALNHSAFFIVILSAKSVSSDNVMDELSFAIEEKKIIIPVKTDSCPVPFRIRRIQHVDFINNYAEGLERLVKTLEYFYNQAAETKQDGPEVVIKAGSKKQIARQKKVTFGAKGFLSPEEIKQVIGEMIDANEGVRNTLLIFKTTTQQTWLVSTSKRLFCLLDEDETRNNGELIMWQMPIKDSRKNIQTDPHKKYSGLVSIGERKNWLYSTSLFPDPSILVERIKNL